MFQYLDDKVCIIHIQSTNMVKTAITGMPTYYKAYDKKIGLYFMKDRCRKCISVNGIIFIMNKMRTVFE